VLDSQHFVRRPVAQFFRGVLAFGDETEGLAMRGRFMEIWAPRFRRSPARRWGYKLVAPLTRGWRAAPGV